MTPKPFGYFNNPCLDGWQDCAETDEGARPLYDQAAIDSAVAAERIKHQAEIQRLTALANTAEKWRGIAMARDGDGRTVQEVQAEAEAAVLAKLAAQDVEPVAWVCWLENDDGAGWKITVGSKKPAWSNDPEDFKVYTEAQLLAVQQRTAEVCAKLAQQFGTTTGGIVFTSIRSGAWREFK